jgi:penicillin-binding protein 1C
MLRRFFSPARLIALSLLLLLFLLFWFTLPKPLFNVSTSAVLEDRNGQLLGALVAEDGQWRFPPNQNVSEKFAKAIVCFEDKRFYKHPGVDPLAMLRAMKQNAESRKVESGGSTLTMQVIRLSRNRKQRNIWQKVIEIIISLRLELSSSKKEILALYASNAPFGGNVVGLDAASWRYFGKEQSQLSWAEAATLAVLPNSPALVHPGRNRLLLLQKRNRLLESLHKTGVIDALTFQLAIAENLPEKPIPLPQYAPHLLGRVSLENSRKRDSEITVTKSSLDKDLQMQVSNIVMRHHEELKGNGINNAAALVADVETGEVLAYVGNVFEPKQKDMEGEVDIIRAPRSTGSILKPFLYAAMLNEGDILPNTLVADIPTQIAGYSPQNFNEQFDGAVPARRALERSLNIPAVRMLRSYGTEKFNSILKKEGMTTLNRAPSHYGLSIILGGAEGNMWDIAGMYASMARTLNHYTAHKAQYFSGDIHPLSYSPINEKPRQAENTSVIGAGAIWCMFNAMEEVSRPDMEMNWKQFSSSQRIAWKTGTSFGFRDGWAVGCTPKYVVIVWVGNADGEGRPGLTGVSTAAPIMFDIFKLLKTAVWFEQPYSDMQQVDLCSKSGYRALDICEEKETMWVPAAGVRTSPCPYHQMIHLDRTAKWRVTSDCESPRRMIHKAWFVLPAGQEWYFKSKNQQYKVLPPYKAGCMAAGKTQAMEFLYPKKSTEIYVPVELDGKTGKAVFEVAHRSSDAIVYWHLDDEYLGYTKEFHQMALSPAAGNHQLTLVDQNGERVELSFEILKSKKEREE